MRTRAFCADTVLTEYSSKAVPQHQPLEAMGTAILWDVKCQPSCGMSGALVVACEAGARHRRVSYKALWKWYYFSEAGGILRQPRRRKAGEPQVQGAGRKVEAGGEKVVLEPWDNSWPSEIP